MDFCFLFRPIGVARLKKASLRIFAFVLPFMFFVLHFMFCLYPLLSGDSVRYLHIVHLLSDCFRYVCIGGPLLVTLVLEMCM